MYNVYLDCISHNGVYTKLLHTEVFHNLWLITSGLNSTVNNLGATLRISLWIYAA